MILDILNSNVILMIPSREAQYHAVQKLVRPWEIEPHLNRNPSSVERILNPPFPEMVARWLRGCFSHRILTYQRDPEGFPGIDYWCAPAYTLRRGRGDCEDFTLIAVSMLVAGGVPADVAVGQLWTGSSWDGHAWVEGADARGGFLIEATSGHIYRDVRPNTYALSHRITPNVLQRAA